MKARRPLGTSVLRSLAFRACVYFAANPEEGLLTSDFVERFGMLDLQHVHDALDAALASGFVVNDGCGLQSVWRAGPELLRLIGRPA